MTDVQKDTMLLSCPCQLWIHILAAAQTRVEILRRSFPLPILPESKGLDVGIVETKQVGSYSHSNVFSGIPQNPLFRSRILCLRCFFTYTFHIEKPQNSPPQNPLKHHETSDFSEISSCIWAMEYRRGGRRCAFIHVWFNVFFEAVVG